MRVRFAWVLLLSAWLTAMLLAGSPSAQPSGQQLDRVLFLTPAGFSSERSKVLIEALAAQFAGTEVEVLFEELETAPAHLRVHVEEAQRLARDDDSIVGVFWLDTKSDRSWLLYLTQPSGDRVLVRRIDLDASEAAAVEAVSVITSRSAEALRSGHTIGMRPVELEAADAVEVPAEEALPVEAPEEPAGAAPPAESLPQTSERSRPPAPTPLPPSPLPRRVGPRLRAGYRGTPFATGIFQHGFQIGAEWVFAPGAYVGAGGVFFAPVDIDTRYVGFRVRRAPVSLSAGWQWARRGFTVDAELAGTLDVLTRTTVRRRSTVDGRVSETRTLLLLGPRLRGAYALEAGLGVYVSAGVDFAMNNFPFVAQLDGEQRELLNPYDVRAVVDAGVLFWP